MLPELKTSQRGYLKSNAFLHEVRVIDRPREIPVCITPHEILLLDAT